MEVIENIIEETLEYEDLIKEYRSGLLSSETLLLIRILREIRLVREDIDDGVRTYPQT